MKKIGHQAFCPVCILDAHQRLTFYSVLTINITRNKYSAEVDTKKEHLSTDKTWQISALKPLYTFQGIENQKNKLINVS